MKVRIKFKKYGVMKFIGHLDIMRFFQKAMRRANVPIAFTGGYSPHMIMSFANPLGVGVTSDAEYFDIEITEPIDYSETVQNLNHVMVDGMEIVNIVPISDNKKKTGMSIVAAADYLSQEVTNKFPHDLEEVVDNFMNQEQILVIKPTKKSEKEMDIKPLIYQMQARDNSIFMKLATGSVDNLKPELVMQTIAKFLDLDADTLKFVHHRLEVYANAGDDTRKEFVSLDKVTE